MDWLHWYLISSVAMGVVFGEFVGFLSADLVRGDDIAEKEFVGGLVAFFCALFWPLVFGVLFIVVVFLLARDIIRKKDNAVSTPPVPAQGK